MTTTDFHEGDNGDVMFTTGNIKHDGSEIPVSFSETSGTLTLTAYGTSPGQRITGTFSTNIRGMRTTCEGEECDGEKVITGSITSSFDGTLIDPSSINSP